MGQGPSKAKRRRPAGRKKRARSKKRAGNSLWAALSQKKSKPRKKTKRKKAIKRRPVKRVKRRRRAGKPFWEQINWTVPGWLRWGTVFSVRVASFCLTAFLIGVGILVVYGQGLPKPDMQAALERPPRITVVDKDGLIITSYGSLYGSPVPVDTLPDYVVQAFVATEDRNFYHHLGVNPVAIIRAIVVNLKTGSIRQGGSTITQQVAKNLFLSSDRTLNRKAQEIFISFWLELNYSKEEILGLYLNHMYFGAGAYGIDAAAERYFRKSPTELSLGEAAMLAGLLKAPSDYSPTSSPEAARARARVVLNAMNEAGFLTAKEVANIRMGKIAQAAPRDYSAAYAVDYAIGEASALLGGINEDVVIRTTFDLSAHKKLEAAYADLSHLEKPAPANAQMAMVAMERDGAIRILIGGRNYADSEFNRAIHARRQPGSVFKPFVYLAAMEDHMRPDDMVLDTPIELDGWQPANYKNRYYGAVTLTEALSRSLNAATISLQETVGRDHVIRVANRFGFNLSADSGPAVALGVFEATPLDVAAAYAAFANEGGRVWPYAIAEIETEQGTLLYQHKAPRADALTSADAMIGLNHMLKAVAMTGSGVRGRVPDYITFGKTGTTQDSRDAWFAGHAGGLAGTVWVGLDNNAPMNVNGHGVSGSGAPAILWRGMMTAALDGRPDVPYQDWTPPKPKWRFPFPFLSEAEGENKEGRINAAISADDHIEGKPDHSPEIRSAAGSDKVEKLQEKQSANEVSFVENSARVDRSNPVTMDDIFRQAVLEPAKTADPFERLIEKTDLLPAVQAASTSDPDGAAGQTGAAPSGAAPSSSAPSGAAGLAGTP